MKIILSFILLFSMLFFKSQDLNSYRKLMVKAQDNITDAKYFVKKSEDAYSKTQQPIYLGYSAVGYFFLAKNSYNPVNKLSYFKKGKKLLEEAVTKDPNQLEIRFLRYLSQKQAPKFLGYYQNLTEDEKFIKENYSKSKDSTLVKEIKKNISL